MSYNDSISTKLNYIIHLGNENTISTSRTVGNSIYSTSSGPITYIRFSSEWLSENGDLVLSEFEIEGEELDIQSMNDKESINIELSDFREGILKTIFETREDVLVRVNFK